MLYDRLVVEFKKIFSALIHTHTHTHTCMYTQTSYHERKIRQGENNDKDITIMGNGVI